MNKFLKYALVGVLTMFAIVAAGCGGSKDDGKVDMNKPIIVGVNPGPHAIIMDNVKKIAEKRAPRMMSFSAFAVLITVLESLKNEVNTTGMFFKALTKAFSPMGAVLFTA